MRVMPKICLDVSNFHRWRSEKGYRVYMREWMLLLLKPRHTFQITVPWCCIGEDKATKLQLVGLEWHLKEKQSNAGRTLITLIL